MGKRWRFFATYAGVQTSPVLRQPFPLASSVAPNVRFDAYRPAFRRDAAATDHRPDQALRQFRRQRRHRYRYLAAADPRAARRERRRQIDAGQDHLRIDPAERRRDALAGARPWFCPAPRRPARAASAWCSSISRCSTISPSQRTWHSASTARNPSRICPPASSRCPTSTGFRSIRNARSGSSRWVSGNASRSSGR